MLLHFLNFGFRGEQVQKVLNFKDVGRVITDNSQSFLYCDRLVSNLFTRACGYGMSELFGRGDRVVEEDFGDSQPQLLLSLGVFRFVGVLVCQF